MLTLIHWLSRCPLWLLHAKGAALGWLAYALSPGYRRRLRHNAQLAGVSAAARRAAVAEAGKLAIEVPWAWFSPAARPISAWTRWEGAELIDQALAGGRGLVMFTPHMGCFEVCAQAYAERNGARHPLTVLYRPARQAWLRKLEETSRERPGLATAPATLAGVRQMLRALKSGNAVGLLPDQVPPDGQGVWAPFFGQPAYTMTLAAALVRQTGAAALLIWAERLPRGRGFVIRVSAPVQPLPSTAADDAALQLAGASAVNREMERLIRQCPAQYLWSYDRYKSPRKGGRG